MGKDRRKCVGQGCELVGGLLEQAPRWAQRAHCCWAQAGLTRAATALSFAKCLDRAARGPGPGASRVGLHLREDSDALALCSAAA